MEGGAAEEGEAKTRIRESSYRRIINTSLQYSLGRNLMYDPAQNEPELGQGFTLSSSRPSQSIPGVILRLVRSCVLIT